MEYGRYALVVCALVCGGCGGAPSALVDVDAEFERAAFLGRKGEHAKAARVYADFAERFEHDRRADYAQYMSGEEYRIAGRYEAASEAYGKLFVNFAHSRYLSRANDRCIEIGRKMLKDSDAGGLRLLNQVTFRSPYGEQSAEAHMIMANHHYASGRFAEAKVEYEAVAVDHSSSRRAPRAALGSALCEYRQIDRPARNIAHALEAKRRFTKLRTAPLTATEMAVVDRYLAEVINLLAERQMLLARVHLKQGQVEPALRYLKDITDNYRKSRYYEAAVELVLYIQEQVQEPIEEPK